MTQQDNIEFNLIPLKSVDSTNNYLKALSREPNTPEFTIVTTQYQTSGRGQRGNFWESTADKNLLYSLLVHPHTLPIQEQFILSEVVSISLVQTLRKYAKDFSIKWPNDIYWKDKKICGILIEHELMDDQIAQSIIGIGLNINQEAFESEAPNPISLSQITGIDHDRTSILQEFCGYFVHYYSLMKHGGIPEIMNLYKELMYRSQGLFYFADEQGIFKAEIKKVEKDGKLHLVDEFGKERVYLFKEVQYII